MLHLVRRDPHQWGIERTRWTLASIRQAAGLDLRSKTGMCRLLKRLGIVWKRARTSVLSPDPNYEAKMADVAAVLVQAKASSGQIIATYLDEVTIERHPSVAQAYAERGSDQARAQRSHAANTLTRVVATLDALSGQVVFRRGRVTTTALVAFFQQLRAAYPDAERIYVILDNWPMHFHPNVLVALEPQQTTFPLPRPPSWPTHPTPRASRSWGHLQLPIQLVPLPTYASWTNPIEKLWRMLRQDVTHLHPWSADLDFLRANIDRFLQRFANGSLDLLRYVGLRWAD
ncbi:MAG: IS630 family transposase [Anaerolineae bacterium]